MACLLLLSCNYFKNHKPAAGQQVVARVGNEFLYMNDVLDLMKGVDARDSAAFVAKFASQWARKKLLLQKAEDNVQANELGIDKKVEDYRESLLLYEYEKALINQKLDKQVKEEELLDFYEKNKATFQLESPVYDVKYARIRIDAEDISKMEGVLMHPKNEDEERRREGYCKAFATAYSFADENWISLPSATATFPISDAQWQQFAADRNWHELKLENEFIFVQVSAWRDKGAQAPFAFIKEQLREVYFNKKKVAMIENIYDQIFQNALKKGDCEVLAVTPKKP